MCRRWRKAEEELTTHRNHVELCSQHPVMFPNTLTAKHVIFGRSIFAIASMCLIKPQMTDMRAEERALRSICTCSDKLYSMYVQKQMHTPQQHCFSIYQSCRCLSYGMA
jgi:hypothetical protein